MATKLLLWSATARVEDAAAPAAGRGDLDAAPGRRQTVRQSGQSVDRMTESLVHHRVEERGLVGRWSYSDIALHHRGQLLSYERSSRPVRHGDRGRDDRRPAER